MKVWRLNWMGNSGPELIWLDTGLVDAVRSASKAYPDRHWNGVAYLGEACQPGIGEVAQRPVFVGYSEHAK